MDAERIHILVVDDLADMANSTAEVLTLWGYDATACDSAATALGCAWLRRPDAVLLDLGMPRMDGFQFARAFRRLPGCEAIPLIAVTGYTSVAYHTRAREVGIDHYLLKPAELEELKALLILVTQRKAVPALLPVGKRWGPRGLRARRRPIPTRAVGSLDLLPFAAS